MAIGDEQAAIQYLGNIGYYRLSAYMHPLLKMPKDMHQYKSGASFDKVLMLYRFDKKLRVLLFNEIEKIEVSVRESIMNMAADQSGDIFWLTNPVHFHDQKIFMNSRNLLKKEMEPLWK